MKVIKSSTLLFSFCLAAVVPSVAQAAQYRDLCTSVPSACEYTTPDVPVLDADVCWDPSGGLTLKTTDSCAGESWPYHVKYGEVVDPVTGMVAAYSPLDNACDHPGVCVPGPVPPGTRTLGVCCEWGVCVPLSEVACNSSQSVLIICLYGESNPDGTITCYDGEYVPE